MRSCGSPASAPPLPACWSSPGQGDGKTCWQLALECSGDGAWDWDIRSGAAFFGPRFNTLLGFAGNELGDDQTAFSARIHPDDRARLSRSLQTHFAADTQPMQCDLRVRSKQGEYQWMQLRGSLVERTDDGAPARMVGTLRDIGAWHNDENVIKSQLAESVQLNTLLEGAQVQLVQSEKLAAIGQLAAGVAHELKTPIGFVNSNFGALERYAGDLLRVLECYRGVSRVANTLEALRVADASYAAAEVDYIREDLPALFAESRDGLDRVQRIVRDLKDFSRVGEQEWQFADLHQGLDSTINILRYEIKHKAVVERHYGDLPKVWCVPSMLNQVFLNLLANAAQAIEDKGTITVVSSVEGDNVVIRISDTGCGMTPDVLERIFTAFFTTKAAGKGTGLGLSLAQDIVRQHHGQLSAVSTPGQGSTFTIELPINTLK